MTVQYFIYPQMPKSIGNFDFVRIILWVCSKDRVFFSTTKLQKLVFMALHDDKEIEALRKKGYYKEEPFQFVPEKFGPYSKDLNLVLRRMERNGEIQMKKEKGKQNEYRLLDGIVEELKNIPNELLNDESMQALMGKVVYYNKLSLDNLLSVVYRDPRFSQYLINSQIAYKY